MTNKYNTIRSQLLKYDVFGDDSAESSQLEQIDLSFFLAKWDATTFLGDLASSEPADEEPIDKVICLVGHLRNARAVSIRQYMAHAWPKTYTRLLDLVIKVLRTGSTQAFEGIFDTRPSLMRNER